LKEEKWLPAAASRASFEREDIPWAHASSGQCKWFFPVADNQQVAEP
jgi:hypothetical protein